MIVLDTDHLSVLQYPESAQYDRLVAAMGRSSDRDFSATVISLEEQMRGWLAAIRRNTSAERQTRYYERLQGLVDFFADWQMLPFDQAAAAYFNKLRRQGIRIGTMDLKIASIACVHDALLLTANSKDFGKVPNLHTEDWLR